MLTPSNALQMNALLTKVNRWHAKAVRGALGGETAQTGMDQPLSPGLTTPRDRERHGVPDAEGDGDSDAASAKVRIFRYEGTRRVLTTFMNTWFQAILVSELIGSPPSYITLAVSMVVGGEKSASGRRRA